MHVIMVMVSSVNGKITRGDNPDVSAFASKEDAQLFTSLKQKAELIIMGSGTYEAARTKIQLSTKTLRIVMTRNPKKYTSVPGQLEFTDEAPKTLVKRLEQKGFQQALLAGGAQINALFLKDSLVDEIHMTIEPWILGRGKNLVEEIDVDTLFHLVSMKQLNDSGTVHLIYKKI